jgi:hypothetical protein
MTIKEVRQEMSEGTMEAGYHCTGRSSDEEREMERFDKKSSSGSQVRSAGRVVRFFWRSFESLSQ